MTQGIVTSLEILDLSQGMGNRGSKSDSHISVKEQRADGSSIFSKYCKVCSTGQGNLVFIHPLIKRDVNTVYASTYKYISSRQIFNVSQKSFYSSKMTPFNTNTNSLNPNYITGFTDGEGCFTAGISSDSKYKTSYRVKATFQIGLHVNDSALLKQIKLFFGVGNITKLGKESVQYRVSGLDDLNVIINHFNLYPLLTKKYYDYLLFKEVIDLMKEGKHLTLEGLNRIVSIKAILNNRELSNNLSLAFPNVESILRPETPIRNIQDLNWLAGFTDAEGCFLIALKKSPASKLGETVWLKYILTQHSRDKVLLQSLMPTLNCGRYISKSNYGEFVVEKFTDIRDKIIPIFEKFKLHGIKTKNYEDFKKAAILIENKAHLTREGLDELKIIKGKMNRERKTVLRRDV